MTSFSPLKLKMITVDSISRWHPEKIIFELCCVQSWMLMKQRFYLFLTHLRWKYFISVLENYFFGLDLDIVQAEWTYSSYGKNNKEVTRFWCRHLGVQNTVCYELERWIKHSQRPLNWVELKTNFHILATISE